MFVVWLSWGAWSCSVTCGRGTESRSRRCISGNTCRGSSRETSECLRETCPSMLINSRHDTFTKNT